LANDDQGRLTAGESRDERTLAVQALAQKDAGMRYILESHWSLLPHFSITDEMGNQAFDVRGHFSVHSEVTFHDMSGREAAKLSKHLMTKRYDIIVGGSKVAEIRHAGIFGEHFQIETPQGVLEAQGSFSMWNYTLSGGGALVAQVSRQLALHQKFEVDIAQGQNDAFILACVLAIDDIHREREDEHHNIGGGLI
jgi:uncharacterized protein YxjI